MGCCFSKNQDSNNVKSPFPVPESDISYVKPPLPPFEEESVKEVLSETHTPKIPSFRKIEEEKMSTLPSLSKIEEETKVEKKAMVNAAEEISEISEICSLSESVSTTAFTERKEEDDDEETSRDNGEVRQRVSRSPAKVPRKRSISCELAGRTERGRKSPARGSEPSPSRRNDNTVKSVYGTEVGQSAWRRISGSNGPKRDLGASSGRRSRSPATRTDAGASKPNLGRSPSSRRTGRSPGRIPAKTPEKCQKSEESKEGQRPTNESLENPLVSLECFIFL